MRLSLLLPALLLAASPAWAAKPKKEEPPPAPPSATAPPPVETAAQVKERSVVFADYESNLASGQKARAADALVAITQDATAAPWHGEAYARLGDIFVELDLPYAALTAWERAFENATDQNVADLGLRVPRAIELAKKVGDEQILEKPFSANLGLARTEDVRGQMAYLAAREHLRKQGYGTALGILKMVKEGDPLHADAKMLEGIILNQQRRPEDALKAFEAAQKAGRDRNQRFKDLVQINIGRTWYGAGNFPRAIEAFARVSRDSVYWPEAQFERAWAHFRIDDFNNTVSSLFSLDTPFFHKYYFPEADQLRIYSMFLLCKFPESEAQIKDFTDTYKPIHEKLQGWAGRSEEDSFKAARAYLQKGEVTDLPEMIWRPFGSEDRFAESVKAVASANDELGRMKNASANPFTEKARDWVEARRDALIRAEGKRIQTRIADQEAQLGQMLADSEIFVLDILRMKTKLYEQAANRGELEEAARTVQRNERVRKGWREWPFEGEIWADELGYYRASIIPECPASLRAVVEGAK